MSGTNSRVNSRVAFSRGMLSATPFDRDDLNLYKATREAPEPDLALMGCRPAASLTSFFPEMKTVSEVRADGALLALGIERSFPENPVPREGRA
ncbi:MAG TPA: hypothetical protein VJK02_24935 [Anaerolineales bacterium]|nr:hypothetical protein [Anaerolineales bacterium]